jgi:hypothetical protein
MTYQITHQSKNGHHAASVVQSTKIEIPPKTVWDAISNVIGLTGWVLDVKKTEFLSKVRKGVGAIRRLTFSDNNEVIEYVVGWNPEHYLSYIATSGLPLDAYHATLSITPEYKGSKLSWTSFLISNTSDKKQFEEFLSFIDMFYEKSLQTLKEKLEKVT